MACWNSSAALHRSDIAEMLAQGLHDARRNIVLHSEEFGHLAVVGLRPQVVATVHVDQLGGDPQCVARPAHRAFQHVDHPERMAHCVQVGILALERKRGRARRHPQAGYAGQVVEQVLGQAIREILLVRVGAQVDEGQYRDGIARQVGSDLRRRCGHLARNFGRLGGGVGAQPCHSIGHEQAQGEDQQTHDDVVEARAARRRHPHRVGLGSSFEPLGGHFEGPGYDQRDGKSEEQQGG